jgi:hypothetical protein
MRPRSSRRRPRPLRGLVAPGLPVLGSGRPWAAHGHRGARCPSAAFAPFRAHAPTGPVLSCAPCQWAAALARLLMSCRLSPESAET